MQRYSTHTYTGIVYVYVAWSRGESHRAIKENNNSRGRASAAFNQSQAAPVRFCFTTLAELNRQI